MLSKAKEKKTTDIAVQARLRLIENLQTHAGMSSDDAELFKYHMTACDYFSRPDHRGGLIMRGQRHYRLDGTEHTFQHVPLRNIIKEAESWIERNVSQERRTEIYGMTMAGIPGHKKAPKWDKPIVNPHKEPRTAFSVSRAVSPLLPHC